VAAQRVAVINRLLRPFIVVTTARDCDDIGCAVASEIDCKRAVETLEAACYEVRTVWSKLELGRHGSDRNLDGPAVLVGDDDFADVFATLHVSERFNGLFESKDFAHMKRSDKTLPDQIHDLLANLASDLIRNAGTRQIQRAI
jgi:hypothetical protein